MMAVRSEEEPVLEGRDLIIQAPTGSGNFKTAIAAGPHLWPSSRGKITIIVSPLLALEEEMVQTFKKQFKLDAVAIYGRNGSYTPEVAKVRKSSCLPLPSGIECGQTQRLARGDYQILLASPEMLQSRQFINRVLRNSAFTRRVLSIVVDEAHCISHWGADFRKKYDTLGIIRAFLPRGTAVVAMTATLTARSRRDIHSKLQLRGSSFINQGNDRPNVSIIVRACEHPLESYSDLDFVLPTKITTIEDVKKTWIYVDNITTGSEIIDHLAD